ncbi:single-stranded DNA-binding protein [Patescibacteria group bacterium]|nr:single-stranded DNA-binding protein [Patescibacteria group bacterium]
MSDLNKAMIIGRLTRDPESRNIPTGQLVSSFSVATNRNWKDQSGAKQEKVEFHNVVAWGKLAEICKQYLNKGKKVFIEGRLQTRSWDDQNGQKKYKTEIIAENMQMLDSLSSGSNSNNNNTNVAPKKENNNELPTVELDNEEEINIEDVPF